MRVREREVWSSNLRRAPSERGAVGTPLCAKMLKKSVSLTGHAKTQLRCRTKKQSTSSARPSHGANVTSMLLRNPGLASECWRTISKQSAYETISQSGSKSVSNNLLRVECATSGGGSCGNGGGGSNGGSGGGWGGDGGLGGTSVHAASYWL